MFHSFVIMLREGIEAALVVAIMLVVLKRSGRRDLERSVFRGVGLAAVASIGAAVAFDYNDAYQGTLYLISGLLVGWMMWWMHRQARSLRTDIEQNIQPATAAGSARGIAPCAALVTGARIIPRAKQPDRTGVWMVGAFAFLMVFREGTAAVRSLGAVNFTTNAMLGFIGSLLGLMLVVVFCVMFVRGSLKVNRRRFVTVTECVLGLFAVQLLVNSYHEFTELGVLPATQRIMALIGPVVRHDSLFILAIVGIPLLIWLTRFTPSVTKAMNNAETRLALAHARREKFYRYGAIVTTLLVLSAVGVVYAREVMPRKVPPPEPVTAENGWVTLPVSKLADGQLHRLGFQSGNKVVRFLVMKTADGKIQTALDACEICGSFGYVQEDKNLVCLNCAAGINPLTISAGGGCNPIPLPSEVTNEVVRIAAGELKKAARLFPEVTQIELTSVDPVCGMTVKISEAAAFEINQGKTYYFCSPHCHELFRQNPAMKDPMK